MKKYIIKNIQDIAFFCLTLPLTLAVAIVLFLHANSLWCMPLLVLTYLTCILISEIAYLIALTDIVWVYKDISEVKIEKWTDALKLVFKTNVRKCIDLHLYSFWFWCPICASAAVFIARLINIYF